MARAVQLQQPREALHLVEGDAPVPGPGEALVRVEACALGQLDWNLLTLDAPPRLPLVPGHEAVGVVEAQGVGAQLPVGTRVLVTPLASFCGACPECKAGEPRSCWDVRWRGVHADGALRSHLACDERALVPLPASARALPAEHLALAGGSAWTAVGAVRALRLARPSRVAVLGVGGVGHLVVQVLRALGHTVLAAEVDPARLTLAGQLGAEPLEGLADAAVVCTPSTQAVQRAVRSVKAASRIVLLGTSPTGRLDVAVAELVWRRLELVGGLLGTREDLGEALGLLVSGALVPQVEVAPLAEAPARLWSLRDLGFGGRLVFVP